MADQKLVYLAGPEVFLPEGADILASKAKMCGLYGFTALSPEDGHIAMRRQELPQELSREIYQANVELMRKSDLGVFDLTPFRGPSADAGTVFELGLMTGLGKPVFGYTNIEGAYIDRVAPRQLTDLHGKPPPLPIAIWNDEDGFAIENFGNADNLMIDGALASGGAEIVRYNAVLPTRFDDLKAFEICLQMARRRFDGAAVPVDPPRQ